MFNSSPSTMLPQEASLSHFPYKLFRGLAFKDLLSAGLLPPSLRLPPSLSPTQRNAPKRPREKKSTHLFCKVSTVPWKEAASLSHRSTMMKNWETCPWNGFRKVTFPPPPSIPYRTNGVGYRRRIQRRGRKTPFYSNTDFRNGNLSFIVLENFLKILPLGYTQGGIDYYYYYYCYIVTLLYSWIDEWYQDFKKGFINSDFTLTMQRRI